MLGKSKDCTKLLVIIYLSIIGNNKLKNAIISFELLPLEILIDYLPLLLNRSMNNISNGERY